MKKRILSLLLAAAMLVLLAVPALAEDEHAYTYVALGDSITTGVGLSDAAFQQTATGFDVTGNYHGYSSDCYVARVADALGLDRDHAINYGMPAAMSGNMVELVQTGSTHSGTVNYDIPQLREDLKNADLITVLIGSNDTVVRLMGALGTATNGKSTQFLYPMLLGGLREINTQTLEAFLNNMQYLDWTCDEQKAALQFLTSGIQPILDQSRTETVSNLEQILQELKALNPDAQVILLGYYNPLPILPGYASYFCQMNQSVKALASQYGADYVPIPLTATANDGHPTIAGHKYIARQIVKAVRK